MSTYPAARPPFLGIVDVGNVIELCSEFSRPGVTCTPFPDPRSHRITIADFLRHGIKIGWQVLSL